jgi:hypothetical protein
MKNRVDRRNRREGSRRHESEAMIVVSGTMVYTPPQLVNPMPSDTLRIGVPIMRHGFITTTGLLLSSGGSNSRV